MVSLSIMLVHIASKQARWRRSNDHLQHIAYQSLQVRCGDVGKEPKLSRASWRPVCLCRGPRQDAPRSTSRSTPHPTPLTS